MSNVEIVRQAIINKRKPRLVMGEFYSKTITITGQYLMEFKSPKASTKELRTITMLADEFDWNIQVAGQKWCLTE